MVDKAQTGADFTDAYKMYHKSMADDRAKFAEEHSGAAIGLEMLGGGLTGIAGAAKVAAPKALANTPQWVRTMLGGAGAGGIYAAGQANPGERIKDAAMFSGMGGMLSPVFGWAGGRLLDGLSWIGQKTLEKLSQTPKSQAERIVRQAVQDEGLSGEEAALILQELGPDGMLMDVGENLRGVARAATDQPGPAKAVLRNVLDDRQQGQQGRIMGSVVDETGIEPGAARQFVARIQQERSAQAKPLYDEAFGQGLERSARLDAIFARPVVRNAMRRAEAIARNEGYPPESSLGLLQRVHYAKQALDSQISREIRQAGKITPETRAKIVAKNELLEAVDEQNPAYAKARQIWSDATSLEDAVDLGRGLFKMRPAELRHLTNSMTEGERLGFRAGAVEAIQDTLDNVDMNFNAVRRLVGKKSLQERMRHLFDSDESFNSFIDDLNKEVEFMRTRQVVSGGSPTSQNLAGQGALSATAEGQAFWQTDTVGKAVIALRKLIGKQKISPETLAELTKHLTSVGAKDEQVVKILTSGRLGEQLAKSMGFKSVEAARGVIVPTVMAGNRTLSSNNANY
jgi:hypothetical protein